MIRIRICFRGFGSPSRLVTLISRLTVCNTTFKFLRLGRHCMSGFFSGPTSFLSQIQIRVFGVGSGIFLLGRIRIRTKNLMKKTGSDLINELFFPFLMHDNKICRKKPKCLISFFIFYFCQQILQKFRCI